MIGQAPVLSVSDFVAAFNQAVDMIFPEVVIAGELANFRISKNAWVYFDLKDDQSTVKFFGSVRSLPGPLEDGMMLEVSGRPYLHSQFGFSVQIISLEPVGAGSINKAYQILFKKLETEGLFDESRKRLLPSPPESVAIIASAESAAYGDFTKIVSQRWPALKQTLFDVYVQGKDAPAQIMQAISDANQHDFDVIVIIRGGGSKDDLSAFDVEPVVRTIASSRIPTLVAIGHERDMSLSELVADVRASTPSNAAERIVPNVRDEHRILLEQHAHLDSLLRSYSQQLRNVIVTATDSLNSAMSAKRSDCIRYAEYCRTMLAAYDPGLPLQRGYSLMYDPNGGLVRNIEQVKPGQTVRLKVRNGQVEAKIMAVSKGVSKI